MRIKNLRNRLGQLSKLEIFFLISIITFLLWRSLHDFVLIGSKIDLWMILNCVNSSSSFLNFFNVQTNVYLNEISIVGKKGVFVDSGCNILKIFGFYISFIFGYPSFFKKKIFYTIIGFCLLFIINIVRIASFVLVTAYFPEIWDIFHKYSSFIFFYPIIFGLWALIIK